MTSNRLQLNSPAETQQLHGSPAKYRFIPIGVRFAVVVVITLVVVALAVGIGLSRVAQQGLVEAKLVGAEMIVDNVASALAPALDFGDQGAVTEYSRRLSATRDVSRVMVWNDSLQLEYLKPEGVARPAPTKDGYHVTPSEIELTRVLRTPIGACVGLLEVGFSLEPENKSYRQLRRKILASTGLLSLVVAALIVTIARISIVVRLKQLLQAMTQLRLGREISLAAAPRDEIGELAAGFNEMASAIRDRERHLSIERDKSHELLDNMRQAILVVDRNGRLSDVRSRQAERLFGTSIVGTRVADLLCDQSRPAIERKAFEEWLEAAFSLWQNAWEDVLALAPSESTVTGVDGEMHVLAIDVRPITFENQLVRIMFLCSDMTAQRSLERTMQQQEAEHDRQMHVMKAILGGNGLQLVDTLRNIDDRIAASQQVLTKTALDAADINEVFQYVHAVKGDASAFELQSLVQTSTVMESYLGNYRVEVQHGATPDPKSTRRELESTLSAIASSLREVRTMVVAASPSGADIFDQMMVRRTDLLALNEACASSNDHIRELVSRALAQPFGTLIWSLVPACQRWADRLSKQVSLEIEGQSVLVPHQLAQVLPAILTQLVRNAVAHGIESEQERVLAQKSRIGRILLRCVESSSHVEIHVADDGRGLKEELAGASHLSASEMAFLPGISTADPATASAGIGGCGVGLGLVRAELVSVGYAVELKSVHGQGLDVHIHPTRVLEEETIP
jgi:HAMP domain-containing protein